MAFERAHLFLDEIAGEIPVWLEEGTASREGDAEGHRRPCRLPAVARMLDTPPRAEIERAYAGLRGAEVLAFTLVDGTVTRRGVEALNERIRRPDELERVAGERPAAEREWHAFVRERAP